MLLAGDAFFLGMAVFDVASELSDFLAVTANATEKRDVDEQGNRIDTA